MPISGSGGNYAWNLSPVHRIGDKQFEAILGAVTGRARDWMLVFTSGNLALRISELLHLKVSDFDLAGGIIRVTRRKKKTLTATALEVADDILSVVKQYIAEAKLKPSDWLFPGWCGPCHRSVAHKEKDRDGKVVRAWREREKLCTGGHLTTRRAMAIWDAALGRIGLKVPKRGIHTLRHYGVTRFYAKTKDLRATQKFVEHSSPLVTQVYADVVDMKEKANQVGASGASAAPWKRQPPRRGPGGRGTTGKGPK